MDTSKHIVKKDYEFTPEEGKICKIRGLFSIPHLHRKGTLPKDFERNHFTKAQILAAIKGSNADQKAMMDKVKKAEVLFESFNLKGKITEEHAKEILQLLANNL